MKLKIFILMFCMILLVGNVNALEFDNGLRYEDNDLKVIVENGYWFGIGEWFGLNEELGIVTLKSHKSIDEVIEFGYGKEEVVMFYDFENWDFYEDGLGEVIFTDMRNGKEINKDYYFVEWVPENIIVNDYKEVCNLSKNGTNVCLQEVSGNHLEKIWNWKKLDNNNIPNKNVRIGLKTYIEKGDYIDAVWTIAGKKVKKHSEWTSNLNTNLQGYWKYDEGTGTTTSDSLGYNNFTFVNSPNWQGGILGASIHYTRANSDHLINSSAITNWDGLWDDINDSITLNQWVYMNQTDLQFWFSCGNVITFGLFSANKIIFTINNLDSATRWDSSIVFDTIGSWQMITARFNGTGVNGAEIFFNGTAVGTTNVVFTNAWNNQNNFNCYIGSQEGSIRFLDGGYDEVGIWDRALSDSEISDLYNNGNAITWTDDFAPTIILNSPIESFNSSSSTIIFNGTVFDISGNGIVNVSLYIDGILNETNSSGINNSNYIFTKIISEGDHNWTYEAWDNASILAITDTRNFTVDSILPSINITSPNETFNFQGINENLSLNWSVNDTNLDLCWYNWDGTNVSVTCSDNQTNINITDGSNKNLTFYANDTFGNENSQTVTWNYKVFLNSETFSESTLEGSTETFSVNVTILSSLTFLAANLNYNSVAYVGTFSTSGDIVIISRDLIIPGVSTTMNYTFNWSIFLSDLSIINTTSLNQTVNNLGVDDCSVFTIDLYNYTLVDEENQTQLSNVSVDLNIDFLSVDRTVKIISFSKAYITNPIRVCISVDLENNEYSIDSIVKYEAINYEIEYYNIFNYSLSNSTMAQNITLYDLISIDSTEFQLTFKGSDFLPVENALVFVNRQYIAENNTFKTVELPKTDSNGQTILHLVRNNILYNLNVVLNGSIIGSFQNIIAFCEDFSIGDCKINLNAIESTTQAFNYQEDLGLIFTSPIFNESTNIMSFDFTTTDGTAKTILMNVTRNDIFGNRSVCLSTLRTSSGTLFCDVGSIDGTYLRTIISVDGSEILNNQIRIDSSNYGNIGYLVLLFMSITLIFLFSESKLGVLIGVILGYVTGIGLGIISSSLFGLGSAGIWLVIITLIGFWKLNQEWQQ